MSAVSVLIVAGLIVHILLCFLVFIKLDYQPGFFSLFDFLGVLAGIYLADFLSGLAHWLGDVEIQWRFKFLREFHELSRAHHRRPSEILSKSYFNIKGNIAFLYMPAVLFGLALTTWKPLSPLVFMLLTLSNFMLLAHSIHKWSHEKKSGRVLNLFRKMHLIIPAEYHLRHHIPPYTENFAAINGWSEPLLAALVRRIAAEKNTAAASVR